MLIFLTLSVVFTPLHLTSADCGGTYENNGSYYNEGGGGKPVHNTRDTYGDAKICCCFLKSGFTIKRVTVTGFNRCIVQFHSGGTGTDHFGYVLTGPLGKGRTIDVYADWSGDQPKVEHGCSWRACDW